jgi:tRNA (guanine37-N1)-methyltransferase
MKFDILTLFPEMFEKVLGESIIGRAVENSIIEINTVNIRDYSIDKHRKVDDYPYGGGAGMVMTPQPIFDAFYSVTASLDYRPRVIYMSPQGRLLNQDIVKGLAKEKHFIILCGHYEGIDQRVIDGIVDDEISIGDYVLTGGELPAMVLIDAVARMLPGVLSKEEAFSRESHYNGLLEHPHYTRPYEFRGMKVPEVLLSGHHEKIEKWRMQKSLINTRNKRPDLLKRLGIKEADIQEPDGEFYR